jgi:hypothetical protein
MLFCAVPTVVPPPPINQSHRRTKVQWLAIVARTVTKSYLKLVLFIFNYNIFLICIRAAAPILHKHAHLQPISGADLLDLLPHEMLSSDEGHYHAYRCTWLL